MRELQARNVALPRLDAAQCIRHVDAHVGQSLTLGRVLHHLGRRLVDLVERGSQRVEVRPDRGRVASAVTRN